MAIRIAQFDSRLIGKDYNNSITCEHSKALMSFALANYLVSVFTVSHEFGTCSTRCSIPL